MVKSKMVTTAFWFTKYLDGVAPDYLVGGVKAYEGDDQ